MPLAPPLTKGLMVDHTVALFASVIPAKDDSCCSGQQDCRCTFIVIFYASSIERGHYLHEAAPPYIAVSEKRDGCSFR